MYLRLIYVDRVHLYLSLLMIQMSNKRVFCYVSTIPSLIRFRTSLMRVVGMRAVHAYSLKYLIDPAMHLYGLC